VTAFEAINLLLFNSDGEMRAHIDLQREQDVCRPSSSPFPVEEQRTEQKKGGVVQRPNQPGHAVYLSIRVAVCRIADVRRGDLGTDEQHRRESPSAILCAAFEDNESNCSVSDVLSKSIPIATRGRSESEAAP
jgi:hypothetical protein